MISNRNGHSLVTHEVEFKYVNKSCPNDEQNIHFEGVYLLYSDIHAFVIFITTDIHFTSVAQGCKTMAGEEKRKYFRFFAVR